MGLHQDRDEEDFAAPVVSISLGDDLPLPRRRHRRAATRRARSSFRPATSSCSAAMSRLAFHGVDRISAGYLDASQGGWVTPKVSTGVTYSINSHNSIAANIGDSWKNGLADKISAAVSFRYGF